MAKAEQAEEVFPADVDRVVNDKIAAAVAAALAEQRDEITATIMAQIAQAPGAQAGSAPDGGVFAGLAMAIAQLTDQGTGRKRIAPEVMVSREAAKVRLEARLARAAANGERPRYRLLAKVYLDEVFVEPGWIDNNHRVQPTEIEWPRIPNEAMEPVNECAKEIYAEFSEWIGAAPVTERPNYEMTVGGLVVMTGSRTPNPRRRLPGDDAEPEHVGQPGFGNQGLKVHGGRGSNGPYVAKRILGTVAEPAREQA